MGFNRPVSSQVWRLLLTSLLFGACLCNSATASFAGSLHPIVPKGLIPSGASTGLYSTNTLLSNSNSTPTEATAVRNGIFSIRPIYPSVCTAGTFLYSSTMVRPTGAVTIQGNFTSQSSITWHISASNGLELHDLSSGRNDSIESMVSRSSNGSISLKVPAGMFPANSVTGNLAPANAEVCHTKSAKTKTSVKAKKTGTRKNSPSALADHLVNEIRALKTKSGSVHSHSTNTSIVRTSRTTSLGIHTTSKSSMSLSAAHDCSVVPHASGSAEYTLTVVAEIPCPTPTLQTCSPTHQPDFTIEQWEAYKVDQFWANYVHNHTGGNLMTNFWNKYIGVGQDEVACTADGSKQHCILDDPCNSIKAPNSYEKVQAMFVSMAMINFASLITQVYETLNTVQNDMLEGGLTASWVNVFQPDPKLPSSSWMHILEILSGLIVFFASFIIFFDPAWAPIAIGLMIGASSVLGMAGNIGPLTGPEAQYEFKLDAIENNTLIVENYVVTNQKVLSDMFDGYYNDGKAGNHSIVDLFKGGAWVGSIPEPDPAFSGSGSNRGLATYLENIVIAGLINTMMKQTVYILFVPYGVPYGNQGAFTEAECENDYIGPDARAGWMGSCTMGTPAHQGMTVFMTSGDFQPVSWYNREFTYPYGGYKYNPLEVMEASVTGYLTKGFNYNATQDIVSQLITDHNNTVVRDAITTLQPKTAGMFNIPVCRIEDFAALPRGGNHKKGTLEHIACTCLSDMANYTDPASGHVTFFRDFVSEAILNELQDAYGGPKNWCPFPSAI